MTTVPSKDVKDVIAMNTTPLNNCLLNMVAIQERSHAPRSQLKTYKWRFERNLNMCRN